MLKTPVNESGKSRVQEIRIDEKAHQTLCNLSSSYEYSIMPGEMVAIENPDSSKSG